jgi:glycosyltransferase involved in cell wall biosynthesis
MHSNLPLVTVGIPTFSRPESLRRSLDCICQQTYPNLEIIVSDNASRGEETQRVVVECMANDSRVKYFRQPSNLGPVANFQFVLDAANGEYFMWMSDDDWRAPRYIEALLNELQADEDAVIAFCDIAVLDETGNRRGDYYQSYLPYLKHLVSGSSMIRQLRFFLQDESYGKASLIYGMLRTREIKTMQLVAMYELYGFYGLDNLIIFKLLGKGKLKIVDAMLYGCTAGNVKYYSTIETDVFKRILRAIVNQLKYLLAYLRLSKGILKTLLAILFPIKLTSFYLHIIGRRFVLFTRNPT